MIGIVAYYNYYNNILWYSSFRIDVKIMFLYRQVRCGHCIEFIIVFIEYLVPGVIGIEVEYILKMRD